MLTGADIQQLKDYVAANAAGGQKQAESTVRLHVTHSNLKAKFIEIRLDLHVRKFTCYSLLYRLPYPVTSHPVRSRQSLLLTWG